MLQQIENHAPFRDEPAALFDQSQLSTRLPNVANVILVLDRAERLDPSLLPDLNPGVLRLGMNIKQNAFELQ
jgi:hypothetical protein